MKPLFLALLAAATNLSCAIAWAAPAAEPSLCQPGEQDLFTCTTRAKKIASLCASKDFSAAGGSVQYRFGTRAKTELQYPETPQPAAGHFFMSSTGYSGGGEAHVRFTNGGYDYLLFDRTVRTNFSGTTNDPAFSAGVVVRPAKGGHAVTLACTNDASVKAAAYEALPKEDFDALD